MPTSTEALAWLGSELLLACKLKWQQHPFTVETVETLWQLVRCILMGQLPVLGLLWLSKRTPDDMCLHTPGTPIAWRYCMCVEKCALAME